MLHNCTESHLLTDLDITRYAEHINVTSCLYSSLPTDLAAPPPPLAAYPGGVNYWTVTMSSFFVLICLGGLVDNALVILVILRCTKKRTVTDG